MWRYSQVLGDQIEQLTFSEQWFLLNSVASQQRLLRITPALTCKNRAANHLQNVSLIVASLLLSE